MTSTARSPLAEPARVIEPSAADPTGLADSVPRRAFEIVLAWVESRILTGELRVGDQLPPERELARLLDVSRAAVREAVRTLQAQGVVRSSVGAGGAGGTTVTAVPANALTRLLRLHVALANFVVDDVVEARIALERLSIRLACRNARASDLAEMRRAIAVMEEPGIDKPRFNDADTALHCRCWTHSALCTTGTTSSTPCAQITGPCMPRSKQATPTRPKRWSRPTSAQPGPGCTPACSERRARGIPPPDRAPREGQACSRIRLPLARMVARASASTESMTSPSVTPRSRARTDNSVQPRTMASHPRSRRCARTAWKRVGSTRRPALTPA